MRKWLQNLASSMEMSMGNCDRWSTPKQIKIEREGEPRGTRRGPLKKGQRKKGKKARIDELLSAMRDAKRYAQWIVDERKRKQEHPERFKPIKGLWTYDPHYEKWFDLAKLKLDLLIAKAISDLQIDADEAVKFMVEKP